MGAGRPKKDNIENNTNVSLTNVVSGMLGKGFSLKDFKKSKFLSNNTKFKEEQWIPLSDAFSEATGLKGIPAGHLSLIRGHSNTAKTTALLELAISAQKKGILPVFIITEMKWSFPHAKMMGLQFEEIFDNETGEIVDYDGFFIYIDRGSLNSVEDVAGFIADLLNEQSKGKLPHDLLFLWDSIGSITCEMSLKSGKNNNEWLGNAMSTQFSGNINQRIVLSRKETSQYTNTLVCINKVWVDKPANPFDAPKMKCKGGLAMFSDASLVITMGNITNAGTAKITATKSKKMVEFAVRTKISIDKNHLNGLNTTGKIIATPHGFIKDTPNSIENYKKQHSKEWAHILGGEDFDIIEEKEVAEDIRDIKDFSIGLDEE